MNIQDLADEHLSIPLENGIHLERDGGRVLTNVPHLVVHHSPSGFEFGYGGSGPADLALNLAEAMLRSLGWQGERMACYDGDCFALAWEIHQDLKWQFVAPMERTGGVIPYAAVRSWVEARLPQVITMSGHEEIAVP